MEWTLRHREDPYFCWTDEGYDPSLSPMPRDLQLLLAMDYGKADIDNGGFDALFSNYTGAFAPEMVEWCERAGLGEAADIIRRAMMRFCGDQYLRSRPERLALFERLQLEDRERWLVMFRDLDTEFYAVLSNNGKTYERAASKWLRETCGITKLETPPF